MIALSLIRAHVFDCITATNPVQTQLGVHDLANDDASGTPPRHAQTLNSVLPKLTCEG